MATKIGNKEIETAPQAEGPGSAQPARVKVMSTGIIEGKKYSNIPGDPRYLMTKKHTDTTGCTWPKGTIYIPLYSGYNNETNLTEQVISIQSNTVIFVQEE